MGAIQHILITSSVLFTAGLVLSAHGCHIDTCSTREHSNDIIAQDTISDDKDYTQPQEIHSLVDNILDESSHIENPPDLNINEYKASDADSKVDSTSPMTSETLVPADINARTNGNIHTSEESANNPQPKPDNSTTETAQMFLMTDLSSGLFPYSLLSLTYVPPLTELKVAFAV